MKSSWICRRLVLGLVMASVTCGDSGTVEPFVPLPPVAAVLVTPGLDTVAPRDTARLVATLLDEQGHALTGRTVTWSSSDTAMAVVIGGLVTARVPGLATITATSEGKSGAAVISVVAVVVSVTVFPPTVDLAPGDTVQLKADAWDEDSVRLEGRTVVWSSSNQAVAAVSPGGLVTAGAVGSATITATVEQHSGTASAAVTQGPISFASVTAGGLHTCGLDVNGVAYCWGENSVGQLGNGTSAASLTPRRVLRGLRFSSLTAGHQYTCGLTTAGAAYCWGSNTWGELGSGEPSGPCPNLSGLCNPVPVAVTGGHTFVAITTGYDHTCALKESGQAFCWGWGDNGELGADNYSASCQGLEPGIVCSAAPILADEGRPFVAIAAGFEHTCGLRPGGAAYCWGHEHHGQLGTGSESVAGPTPRAVTGGLLFTSLAAGGNTSCGVVSGGAPWCWGENGSGQLGDLTTVNRFSPVAVSGGLNLASVTVGLGFPNGDLTFFASHACGLTTSGATYCWGNGVGLGDGSTVNRPSPAAVAGGLVFGSVSAGAKHTCGLTANQVAYCWGSNTYGQLGNGSTSDSSVPLRVGGQP